MATWRQQAWEFFYFPQYSTNPLYSYPYGKLTLPNWMIFWDLVGKNLVIVCKSLLVKCQTAKYSLNLPKKIYNKCVWFRNNPHPPWNFSGNSLVWLPNQMCQECVCSVTTKILLRLGTKLPYACSHVGCGRNMCGSHLLLFASAHPQSRPCRQHEYAYHIPKHMTTLEM